MVISSKRRKPSIRFCVKFLYIKFLLHQVPTTMEITSQDSCMYVVVYCSLAKSGRLICIARRWKFHFVMVTSVRAKRFTGSSGKTSLDLSKCFSRIGCWAYGRWLYCLMHKVACWVATVDRVFLRHFCVISYVKPHYFCSAFRSTFLLSQLPILRAHTACLSSSSSSGC